jgi:hypothetical protein
MWKTLLYYPLLSSAAVAKTALHRLQTTQTVTMAAEEAMGIQRRLIVAEG